MQHCHITCYVTAARCAVAHQQWSDETMERYEVVGNLSWFAFCEPSRTLEGIGTYFNPGMFTETRRRLYNWKLKLKIWAMWCNIIRMRIGSGSRCAIHFHAATLSNSWVPTRLEFLFYEANSKGKTEIDSVRRNLNNSGAAYRLRTIWNLGSCYIACTGAI